MLITGTWVLQGEYEAALTVYDDHVSPRRRAALLIAAVGLLVSQFRPSEKQQLEQELACVEDATG